MSKNTLKIKTYCYSNNCGPIVITGFHLEQYPVCTVCHEEISENLKNSIDSRNKDKKEEPDTAMAEEEDEYQIPFPFFP